MISRNGPNLDEFDCNEAIKILKEEKIVYFL
jgi:hypothetical protein